MQSPDGGVVWQPPAGSGTAGPRRPVPPKPLALAPACRTPPASTPPSLPGVIIPRDMRLIIAL